MRFKLFSKTLYLFQEMLPSAGVPSEIKRGSFTTEYFFMEPGPEAQQASLVLHNTSHPSIITSKNQSAKIVFSSVTRRLCVSKRACTTFSQEGADWIAGQRLAGEDSVY